MGGLAYKIAATKTMDGKKACQLIRTKLLVEKKLFPIVLFLVIHLYFVYQQLGFKYSLMIDQCCVKRGKD